MASPSANLHFVLFPLLAPGHMVPMIDMARILAHHGSNVTIITTPLNANRYKPIIARAVKANLKIQIIEVKLKLAEVGLPEGCESFDTLPSPELAYKLFTAINMLKEPSELVLRELSPAPSCIISDSYITWTSDVAQTLDIPKLVFHGPGCFWLMCMHVVSTTNVLSGIESDSQPFVLPELPDRIEVTKLQLMGTSRIDLTDLSGFRSQIQEREKYSYGFVVNSFDELEPEYVKELAKAKDKKVYCLGPVSLCNKDDLDIAERGNKAAVNEHDCLEWLDGKDPGSVMYICLGTLTRVPTEQVIELGLGLESTNIPFIWCIRNETEELQRWFSESGFEERVGERGLIIHGWAPQVMILSHRALGGFITHCGWNSTLEAVCAGLPMVTWPHLFDQFLNEKFITEVLKIGVRIGIDIPADTGEQDKAGALVKKEEIKAAIECLMNAGEEGERRRKRAQELAEMAKKAMEEGGSSHLNVITMIQDVTEQLAKNMKPSHLVV
ncbi:UDP-glucuronosyl/UDP-glucosyltransferase [Artemisia annua]|uniref:Glycosyltransferase n=1 Tax=Artemisia annua TaxID=35608 RepID=A0A2U1KIF4_ARTAN|nr:UDP-glucuronosyl/UDP-glucosyltransferase [Artemisia annua]